MLSCQLPEYMLPYGWELLLKAARSLSMNWNYHNMLTGFLAQLYVGVVVSSLSKKRKSVNAESEMDSPNIIRNIHPSLFRGDKHQWVGSFICHELALSFGVT